MVLFQDSVEAWEELLKKDPDLLITGTWFPRLRAREFVGRLMERKAEFPIIVMSTYEPEESWVREYANRGINIKFLSMPFDVATFQNLVAASLKIPPDLPPSSPLNDEGHANGSSSDETAKPGSGSSQIIPIINQESFPIVEAELALVEQVSKITRRLCGLPHATPDYLVGLARALYALQRLPAISAGVEVEYSFGVRFGGKDDYDELHYTFQISDHSFCLGTMFVKQALQGGHDHQTTTSFELDRTGYRSMSSTDEEAGVDVLVDFQKAAAMLDENSPEDILLFVSDKSSPECMRSAPVDPWRRARLFPSLPPEAS